MQPSKYPKIPDSVGIPAKLPVEMMVEFYATMVELYIWPRMAPVFWNVFDIVRLILNIMPLIVMFVYNR